VFGTYLEDADLSAACSPDTEWVVVTNGDNKYHKEVFSSLLGEADADAVAWDFYSRYYRPTGIPCERLQVRLCCSINTILLCFVDGTE
jgi:hypothetical protein